MSWPMLEKIAVAALNARISPARAGTKIPGNVETLPGGFVRVTRGPGSDDGITDSPLLDVESFHPDREKAWGLAEKARQALLTLGNNVAAGSLVDSVATATSPNYVFYGAHVERYVASYRVHLRQQ